MDILEILDPDPHENLCGSETLRQSVHNSESINNLQISRYISLFCSFFLVEI